jgi:hypothetical protein
MGPTGMGKTLYTMFMCGVTLECKKNNDTGFFETNFSEK